CSSSTDTPCHLDTLLSCLERESSTSSPSLPARQLAYIEALAALSPDSADGWEEKAAQGVVWTKEALEQLVEVLEKVGTGTTADLGEGGLDGESARKDVLSARVVSWLEGIAEHVARQVEETKDAKGKGKAVEGHPSPCTQSHPQNWPLPQQQGDADSGLPPANSLSPSASASPSLAQPTLHASRTRAPPPISPPITVGPPLSAVSEPASATTSQDEGRNVGEKDPVGVFLRGAIWEKWHA
ncbi:hypothetical protein BJY59DRAFT_710712, partial [Rhodotorula toruloides]